ncbi:MAG: arginase family protein [Proteobacteria bacterium]|nr:arginase family protein [Pseudomonadota bacterium]
MDWLEQFQHYLCPAGDGVFTVRTAQEKKLHLQKLLYGSVNGDVVSIWKNHLEKLNHSNVPVILGICSDSGGGILRGANWGPLFIREALYQKVPVEKFFDCGDVRINPHLLLDKYLNEVTIQRCRKVFYGDSEIPLSVSPLSITESVLTTLYENFPNKRVLGLGGDHSVSYALIKPYLLSKHQQEKRVAVIHFDAHTDLLAERLGIDICFGSWAYHILPYLSMPSDLIQIGIRSSGHDKAYWESQLGIEQYWADDIMKQGCSAIARKIIRSLKHKEVDEIYVTFDIDCLDVKYAFATGTPEPNGLTPRQAIQLIRSLAKVFPVTGADMMEVAPFIKPFYSPRTTRHTAVVAADICEVLLRSML